MPANAAEWIGFAYAIAGGVLVLGMLICLVCTMLEGMITRRGYN